jgi:O-acetyl-ADP-ribose deacetylase (regulator of RNase III)
MVYMVKGNVFESGANIIAHGCNTKGGFGSGVAGAMAEKYPAARNAYISKYKMEGWKLGDVQFVLASKSLVVANCATQNSYMPRGRCHANYSAIRTCMEKVRDFAKDHSYTIAIPKIGAGLAGGDWNKIKTILDEVFVDYDVTVRYLE